MIDWGNVLANSIWLVGLALVLAAVSFESYLARVTGLPFKQLWTAFTYSASTRSGALLFCTGMALTAVSWVEKGVWALLDLYIAYTWARGRGRHLAPYQQAEQPERSSTPLLTTNSLTSWVNPFAEWLVRAELLILALLSPFFLFPAPERVLPLAILPVLWLARRVARKHFIPPTPFDWAIALLLVMVLVSMYATFDLAFSLEAITLLLFGIGLYYALVEWNSGSPGAYSHATTGPTARLRADRRLVWTFAVYVLAGVALASVGLLGTQWASKLPGLGDLLAGLPTVLRGLSGEQGGFNPNIVGGGLLWIVPLQLALAWWSWVSGLRASKSLWLVRLGLLASLAITTMTLVFTQSRGALASSTLGTVILLGLVLPRRGRLALAVLLAAAISIGLLVGPGQVLESVISPVGSTFNVSSTLSSGASRLDIWSRALFGIEDFPFTGMGMGTFVAVLPVLYPLFSVQAGIGSSVTHAHNQFLQAALDLGLPGLIAFIAVWLLAGRIVVLTWRASVGWHRAATAGIATGLLESLVFGMTDTVVLASKPGIFFWALLGLLVALWQQSVPVVARSPRAE